MAERRARADEYARRVNRAVALLSERRRSPDVRRALQAEYRLSERQARRYVRAAERAPGGVEVPEQKAVFTVKLPVSLIVRLRRAAASERRGLGELTAQALRTGLPRSGGGESGAAR